MTPVDGASRAQPHHPSSAPTRADPGDVRAMREALEAARGRVDKLPVKTGGKAPTGAGAKTAGVRVAAGDTGRDAAMMRADRGEVAPRYAVQQRDETEAVAAWNGQPAQAVPVPVAANLPSPQVDPGAFAQMLADLWTRENGRGSKEIHVRFGDRAWPATGARLVRTAAGSLDVALLVGDGGQAYGGKLPGLEEALGRAGVDVASLLIENDG